MATYFSEYFGAGRKALRRHGAFDISLVTDLPLFIDPFLLFNSRKKRYKQLHQDILNYLAFLRDRAKDNKGLDPGLLSAWYRFPEVRQTWLGFTRSGNRGHGLGRNFAVALHKNLNALFADFGKEKITQSSHLEKLCLIEDRVGRDNISDFATNLIKGFLCEYTEAFAKEYIAEHLRRRVVVLRARFNYDTQTWRAHEYDLPWLEQRRDYVLLTPRDLLTRDDTWINKTDLLEDFETLPDAVPNAELRAQINNYFRSLLPKRTLKPPTKEQRHGAAAETIRKYPILIDAYIRTKEDSGDRAESISTARVEISEQLFIQQVHELQSQLLQLTAFYSIRGNTHTEAHQRVAYLKDVIENKGGHRIFYVDGEPIERETDLHVMYRLCWFGTPSDVTSEANDGRGPADFKVSRGSRDKTIVEFKLAKNSQLERNLEKQTEIYKKASDARRAIHVIIFFSREEERRVMRILRRLKLEESEDVVLIDARKDNKPSASKA